MVLVAEAICAQMARAMAVSAASPPALLRIPASWYKLP